VTDSGIENASQSGQAARSGWTWSLGGSLFASLCCLGPAVAAFVGIGSASLLLGLSRYRVPLLLAGLGVAVLGLAKALRQSRQTCSLDQHRRNLWLFSTVTLLTFAVTYGVLTYVVPTAVYNSLGSSVTAASPVQIERDAQQAGAPSETEVQTPATPAPAAAAWNVPACLSHSA
jgi:hypothetical protein